MDDNLLERIHALAASPPDACLKILASVARKFSASESAMERAHGVAGLLRKQPDPLCRDILSAVERVMGDAAKVK